MAASFIGCTRATIAPERSPEKAATRAKTSPKTDASAMLLRAMRPDVLAFDEISAPEDIEAMRIAAGCGVALLATAHAQSVGALRCRTLYRALLDEHIFRRAVCITRSGGKRVYTVEDLT